MQMKFSMTIAQLKSKWPQLSENNITRGYRSLRISSECISDIFIGINKEAHRCLILALPGEHQFDFKGIIKENLTIEYFKEPNFIVLQLIDNTYYDLFDDLIISLYQRIKDISEVPEYSKEFISTFHKWSEFFEDKKSELLPEEVIKGLLGELLFLKFLINESNSYRVNDVLNSWKGPYDKGHDFELDSKDIEVKTKHISALDVRISSEFQLEKSYDKGLDLVVISVENDSNNGISLKDLALEIKKLIVEKLGDNSIFLKALSQKGLTLKNINQYDIFRFKPIDQITYNCTPDKFPKLIKSNIPKEINSIKYNLRLSSLAKYMSNKKEF
jgi:hypothetical protein